MTDNLPPTSRKEKLRVWMRKKCAGRTKGDFRGSYPCAKNSMHGSDYCFWHDPKNLDAKESARLKVGGKN